MKELRFILIIAALVIISSGCTKEDAVPDLPPQGSMVMQIDNFWEGSPSPVTIETETPHSNFLFAAGNVYVWSTVLTLQMAVPVAAYRESFNNEAVWDRSAKEWVWSYDIDFNTTTYSAELHSNTSGDSVNWEMYISKSSGYTDFLWFSGVSNTANTAGSWTLNKDPDNIIKDVDENVPFLVIEWAIEENGTTELTYTNIEESSANNGNYIKYGKLGDPDLDAFYDIYKNWDEEIISIRWNTTDHYGRVLSMTHFQDPYWHCWNESFLNIACED